MNYDDINKEAAARAFFDKIKHIVLVNEWSDDHIPCATVNIELYDGTTHKNVEFAYVGSGGIAALTYYDHPRAQLDFFNNNVPQIIDTAIDGGFDYAGTVLHESQEAADELDIKAERLILELADLDINSFDGE